VARANNIVDNHKNVVDLWLSSDGCVAFYAGVGTKATKKIGLLVCFYQCLQFEGGFFFEGEHIALGAILEKTTILESVFLVV